MAKKSTKKTKTSPKGLVATVVILIVVALLGGAVAINITEDGEIEITTKTNVLELSEEQVELELDLDDDAETVEPTQVLTVESVDAEDELQSVEDECAEDEECGRGFYAPTESPTAFYNATYGTCVDTDGHFGSQCWDLANLFWQNYAGRTLSTWGTGGAKGTVLNEDAIAYNAGDEFVYITDLTDLQAGDWVVFTNGTYGHIGMAVGAYNNGYIALLGANQGGRVCDGGGSTVNVVNISLKYASGAFRPKSYIVEDTSIETEDDTEVYTVVEGDTLSEIVRNNGWFDGTTAELYTEYLPKLAEANGIEDMDLIYPDEEIKRV